MEFKELMEKIIGFSCRVYNTPGFEFVESVYENALGLRIK